MKTKKTKKAKTTPFEPFLLEQLKDAEFAAEYLSACLAGDDDEDFLIFFDALSQVVKAHGVNATAARMEVTRDALQKVFKKHQNPTLKTFRKMLASMNLGIAIISRPQEI